MFMGDIELKSRSTNRIGLLLLFGKDELVEYTDVSVFLINR